MKQNDTFTNTNHYRGSNAGLSTVSDNPVCPDTTTGNAGLDSEHDDNGFDAGCVARANENAMRLTRAMDAGHAAVANSTLRYKQ